MPIKSLPNNIEAEESVLGACFLSKYALQKACENLTPDSFYDEKNGKIFAAMNALVEEKTPIDITTITSYLKKNNQLTEVGGVEYLTEVLNFVPTASNIDYYIKNVEDASILRSLIETATEIASEGYRTDETVNEILDNSEKKILNIVKNRKSSEFRSIKDILQKTQADLERLSEHKGEVTGLATGWYDVDKLTTGLHPNELIIIAARPAMGKTAFALNVALNAALKADAKVLIFSLEMAKEQLSQRLLSMEARVESQKMSTGDVDMSDWDKMSAALDSFNKMSIYIDDTPGIKLMEIKNKCRRMKAETGLDMIILDYLQLMEGEKRSDNRQQEITSLSRGMKLLAREMECPVIVLSQLSRAPDQRENHRPVLSDLRESGAIEQDADVVLFLYRDEVYNEETEKPGICEVIVAKHRNGPIGTVEVGWQGKYTRFVNLQR